MSLSTLYFYFLNSKIDAKTWNCSWNGKYDKIKQVTTNFKENVIIFVANFRYVRVLVKEH